MFYSEFCHFTHAFAVIGCVLRQQSVYQLDYLSAQTKTNIAAVTVDEVSCSDCEGPLSGGKRKRLCGGGCG